MEVFPIVHTRDGAINTAIREADRALKLGADGVYLTDQFNGVKDNKPLFETYRRIQINNPEKYVGINIFSASQYVSINALAKFLEKSDESELAPSGLWVDDIRFNELKKRATIELINSDPKLQNIRLLGGIAYKHTSTYTENPVMAANETVQLMDLVDVAVANGMNNDGSLAVEKLSAMKDAARDKTLAVVGNLSIENVARLDGIADEIIVTRSSGSYYGPDAADPRSLEWLINFAHFLG